MLFPPLSLPLSCSLQSRMPQLTPLSHHFTAQSASFHRTICLISSCKMRHITRWIALNRFTFHYQLHQCFQLPLKQPTSFQRVTTPLSLRRGAGGEALFVSHYFPFNYQSCHPHNHFTTQLGTSCSFDSPGLTSESEVYPGLFAVSGNNAVGVVPFISRLFITAFHAENVQHLRR